MDEASGAPVNRVSAPMPPFHPDHAVSQNYAAAKGQRIGLVWSAVNKNAPQMLAALVVLCLVIACGQGATKLLWGDELITLAIARQGSLRAIWHALALGADPNPPLTHWMVMLSTTVLGQGALAVRLPAILCVLLAIVSMWTILRRWVTPVYAATGVLAFMATRGFDYAYDARSYAPLMGFAMLSLALWLHSTERRGWSRSLALGGIAAALALGISSNYYGVLAFFPIAAGEAVLAGRDRRLRPGVWMAMAVAAVPLWVYLPLIHHNIAEFTPHAWNRPQAQMISDSYIELVEGVFWPVLALAVYAGWRRWVSGAKSRGKELERVPHLPEGVASAPKPHEITALAVLALYPILGFCVAAGGAGMISPRCVVPVCCGFGVVAALLCRFVFGDGPRAAITVLTLAFIWVVARESACAVVLGQQRGAFFTIRNQVAADAAAWPERPIVVGDSLLVLPLAYYGGDAVQSRLIFPIDFDAIHRIEKDDSGEQNLWAGRDGLFPMRVVSYDRSQFPAAGLWLEARPGGWLAQQLRRDGFVVTEPGGPPRSGSGVAAYASLPWQALGGVFTPMAHEETRHLLARRLDIVSSRQTSDK